jgi:hypothetical protein
VGTSLEQSVQTSSWERLVKQRTYSSRDGYKYSSYVLVKEITLTPFNASELRQGKRTDFVYFIPVVVVEPNNRDCFSAVNNLHELGFVPYESRRIPMPLEATTGATINLDDDNEVQITVGNTLLTLDREDQTAKIIASCNNLSIGIRHRSGDYFSRISSSPCTIFPSFPGRTGTLLNHRLEATLAEEIARSHKYKIEIAYGRESYLGMPPSSDYDFYVSTKQAVSLPPSVNLGGRCLACNGPNVTREHCSPKWLADMYAVEPLVARILCRSCNSWFGKILEEPVADMFQKGTPIDFETLSKWSIKTAITMSIAAGSIPDLEWLPKLRDNQIPQGLKVYFDAQMRFNERGFAFGISKLSDQLREESHFLFGLTTPVFSMFVINAGEKRINIPLNQIYPDQLSGESALVVDFSRLYQRVHEELTDERTVDISIPIRPSTR